MPPQLVPELICSDLVRSTAFYCDVLGFKVRYGRPGERFAYLERDGAELMLEQPFDQTRLFPAAELQFPLWPGVNFQIAVTDVDAVHAAVLAAGSELVLAIEKRWYERATDDIHIRQFAVRDPDGYLLRFSEDLGRVPADRIDVDTRSGGRARRGVGIRRTVRSRLRYPPRGLRPHDGGPGPA